MQQGLTESRRLLGSLVTITLLCLILPESTSAEESRDKAVLTSTENLEESIIGYPAEFFVRYQPVTALDMVQQIPGFQLDDGENTRGFANAVGNILINDRYPSVKRDLPSAILSRIPSAQVDRIELIRGQVRGIDLQSQPVVANIILVENAPATIRWEAFVQHSNSGPIRPGVSMSLSDRWRDVDYNIGVQIERNANGEYGTERVFNEHGQIIENRSDDLSETGFLLSGIYLNSSYWLGRTLLHVNGKVSLRNGPEAVTSVRIPVLSDDLPHEVSFKLSQTMPSFEVGMDAERMLRRDLIGKVIFMFINSTQDLIESQRVMDTTGTQTLLRVADSQTDAKEGIGRLELNWSGLKNHAVQTNIEAAYNLLDGILMQTVDTGGGPVVVDVPGSNTRVEELRGDFLLKDIWSSGHFELDYGMGAETSTISQTGDEQMKRSFFFLKPHAGVSYSPEQGRQTRFRLAREVAQLDFNDFVSAAVFEDDDLALGNPNLRPDRTWIAELSHERRFGSLSAVKMTGFYHWITDVLDLLPLSSTLEVPGNIGDGRRWGVELETTIPLEWLNLDSAKLNFKARWQDSRVVDPVTGEYRALSARAGFQGPPVIRFQNESKYAVDISYRQDFEAARAAWGWGISEQAERPLFKVNELDTYNEGLGVNAFVEFTRWFGLKMRLEGYNLLNWTETRNRKIFMAERGLSPLRTQILRERVAGRRVSLLLSGNF